MCACMWLKENKTFPLLHKSGYITSHKSVYQKYDGAFHYNLLLCMSVRECCQSYKVKDSLGGF